MGEILLLPNFMWINRVCTCYTVIQWKFVMFDKKKLITFNAKRKNGKIH